MFCLHPGLGEYIHSRSLGIAFVPIARTTDVLSAFNRIGMNLLPFVIASLPSSSQ